MNTEVFVNGKQRIKLEAADFVAQGGEGSVYIKKDMAYKIYSEPGRMIPGAKIVELGVLARPEIIRPRDILTDKTRNPVGYTMASVTDAVPLCQTLTRAYRDRHQITPDIMLRLVRRLQEVVGYVHTRGVLMVDLNETNFLVSRTFDRLFCIDVDTYQTPSYPATALMETVRDRHAGAFSADTDWFAFAVVSFQMFVGIHPYRGKHPSLKTLDERMLANVSVLNSCVSMPAVCQPLDVIPAIYRDWYRAVFEMGKRLPPPASVDCPIVLRSIVPHRISGHGVFHVEVLQEFEHEVLGYAMGLAITAGGVVVGGRTVLGPDVRIGVAQRSGHAIAAWVEYGRLRLFDIHRMQPIACDISGEAVVGSEGRLFVKHGASLSEVQFVDLPATTIAQLKLIAGVMERATQLFEGVALQSLLGATYATLLPASAGAPQVRLPELDGYRIVDAGFQSGVLIVAGVKSGRNDRFVFRFDDAFRTYDVRPAADVATAGVNFAVLSSGVCLNMTDDGAIELFASRMGASGLKLITDDAVDSGCRLHKNGSQALFSRGRKLYKFSKGKV